MRDIMAITNDFFEFMQQPRCKTALMAMTIIVFLALAISEVAGQPSVTLQTLAASCFSFWAGRATKSASRK
mgnify:CR=1 FL=1